MSPHSFRRRGRRRARPEADRSERGAREAPAARVYPVCPVCGEAVRDLASALTHRQTGQPAHFDCIVKELKAANPLGAQERLCYLGGGVFGVLTWRVEGNPASFVINRRIPYEDPRAPQDWKKQLQAEGQAMVGMPVMGEAKPSSQDAGSEH
jgi:hypothetical protein